MYYYRDFNENNLFQYFNGWFENTLKQFHEQNEGIKIEDMDLLTKGYRKISKMFEAILIHANYIILNLKAINILENKILNQFNQIKNKMDLREDRIIIYSPTVIELLGKISSILISLSFIQNRIPRLLGKQIKKHTPNSLNTFIKKNSSKYEVSNKYYYILKRYWTKVGKRIKLYRDVEQHHFILTKNVYLQIKPEIKLIIMFPDNPEVKKPEELTYNKEYDAIQFLNKSFELLHLCIEEMARELGHSPLPLASQISLDTVGDLRSKEGTIAVMFENLELMRGIIFDSNNGKLLIKPFQIN